MNCRTLKRWTALLFAGAFSALLPGATVGYVYPAGARVGETVQVIVGGQGLWAVRNLSISGSGVKLLRIRNAPGTFFAGCGEQNAWAREYMRRVFNGEHLQPVRDDRNFGVWRYNGFMEELDQLDPFMLSLACKGLFERPNSLQASPAIAQKVVLTLQIAPDAEPGLRELRLIGPPGNLRCTNPLLFYIGTVPEFREQDYQMPPLKKQPVRFTFPSAVNGQIEPGETDRFTFRLGKGEKVHFILKGRKLNPFIGDGVPGNFQPVLEIRDAEGRSLAFADDNYFDPDPVLEFQAPAEGLYTLEIRDALYRGRADFVYRIDALKGGYSRPPIPRPPCDLPERSEEEAARDVLKLPVLISGTLAKKGEIKRFRFHADKDQQVAAEIFARRQGSPLDSLLRIHGPDGRQITVNDDFHRPNIGLAIQHVDSYIRFKAPEKGVYTVTLEDTAGAGGKDYRFYLRLDQPRPDFRVYAVPSAVWVSQDRGADPVKVVVERFDGFNDEISFELKNAGRFSLAGIRSIPAGASESAIAFSAYGVPARKNRPFFPELYAVSGGIRRKVRGADAAMQAFAYTHYVPAERFMLLGTWLHGNADRFAPAPGFRHRITLEKGASASFDVIYKAVAAHRNRNVAFTLPDPPKGVSMTAAAKGNIYTLTFTAAKDAPPCDVNTAVKVTYTYTVSERNGRERKAKNTFDLPMMRLTVR